MRVVFKRDVLVSTRQYENQRVGVELDNIIQASDLSSISEEYNRLKGIGLALLTDQIIELKMGAKMQAHEEIRASVKRDYNLV